MSIGSDSQVVEALQDVANLERFLAALGCSTDAEDGRGFRDGALISCPMPDHPDVNPSCVVRGKQGLFACQSLCEVILPADLVIAHGHATDRGEAMKWIESKLGLERRDAPPPVPLVTDPSLTVDQYLAMKGLPAWIAPKFGLEDVRIWQPGNDETRKTKGTAYVTDWYAAVFMPTRAGRRPRARSEAPGAKVKWAPKARHMDGRLMDYSVDTSKPGPAREWPLDVIGFDQLEPTQPGAPNILVVVEGESDTHAMHAMGLPCVVGLPGSQMPRRLARELLECCLVANEGNTDLSHLTVVVWQEPGSAGAKFPKDVASHVSEAALQAGFSAPRFVTLHHAAVPTAPKDPAALLMDRPPELAREQIAVAILAALPQASVAADIGSSSERTATAAIQPALTALQPGGEHTVPPNTIQSPPPLDETLPAALPPGWSAESLPAPAYMVADGPPSRSGPAALWDSYDTLEGSPARDLAPERVEGVGCSFVRTLEGWSIEKVDKDGDIDLKPICSAFVVERVERCSEEILVRIAAPFGGAWNRVRMSMSTTADAGRACAILAAVGVVVANRQRPSVTDLLLALTRWQEQETGAVHVPSGTGWSGRPGTSPFGGVEVEPVNEFGARMFEANERRRDRVPDTVAAARDWWTTGVLPLIAAPDSLPTASAAAPMLALGAASAAPLVGPLAEVGIAVAPVVWIAGLGGGGKTITQKLAASIFAPSLPDLDGQSAYFANANISQAALSARVDSCRDLPLILDDVTQLPPLPGSNSRGDAARIEAAAALGMMVFNRKPIERATRDGAIRQTKAFRSSALFSAEVSMSSEVSKAVVTAGHRRRISTIEARPMTERGLGQEYAEHVNDLSATIGGAPGELLIARTREVVASRTLRTQFDSVRSRIAAMPEAGDVTETQRQSLAVNVLGFIHLAETSAGWSFADTLEFALATLRPYLAAGAGAGGATRDSDLSGVEAALRSVADMQAAHPLRFESQRRMDADTYMAAPTMGYLGKELRARADGTRRIALLRSGMEMLSSRYGVTMQVIEQAASEKCCKVRHQFRMWDGERVYGTLWLLPPAPHEEEDDPEDDEPGHDTDPHGLTDVLRVPGAGNLTVERGHAWEAPPAIQVPEDYVPELVPQEQVLDIPSPQALFAPLVVTDGIDWVFDLDLTCRNFADLCNMAGVTRMLYPHDTLTEGERMDARFSWGSGLYNVGDGPSMRENPSILKSIRMEAQHELQALQMQYRHAHEAALVHREAAITEGMDPGAPFAHTVGDFLADDDPRWSKIDAIGQETARAQWKAVQESLYEANHATDAAAKFAAHDAHIKAYRVVLMARYRHPEWFIQGTDRA